MESRAQRVLSVAARTGRIACVVLDDGDLVIWDASEKAASSASEAAKKLRAWVQEFKPDVLITENPDATRKKRGVQIPILKAMASVGEDSALLNLVVRRTKRFRNAYIEAAHLGEQFPDLAHLVPKKPAIWQREPYNLACFEALALVREAGLLKPDNSPESDGENGS
jgi:hypothetical protein